MVRLCYACLRRPWDGVEQARLKPYIESRTVVGFFVGDELFPGKITVDDFMTALRAMQMMKTQYPWLITWENEGGTGWVKAFKDHGLPDELDIISTDDYYMWQSGIDSPQSQVDGHRQFYESEIYPLLKPHQKVFIVPGSFGTHDPRGPAPPHYPHGNSTYCYGASFDSCDRYMADQAEAFANWAFDDPLVAGIAPWHWDTRGIGVVTPFKEVGVRDMPKTREAWRGIGERMRAASSAGGVRLGSS